MKKLVLSAVFAIAGFGLANAQTVKATISAKTEVKPANVLKSVGKDSEKAETTVSQILKETQGNSAKVADSASQTAKYVTATTGQGLITATVAAQDSLKTDKNLKGEAKIHVKAEQNANANAAFKTETAVKAENQPANQPKEKAEVSTEKKLKGKTKVD